MPVSMNLPSLLPGQGITDGMGLILMSIGACVQMLSGSFDLK